MMPVVPTAKRSHGFTIDSLMGKDTPPPSRPRSRSRSPPDSHPHQRSSHHHHQHPASSSASTSPSSTCGGERGVSSSVPINLTASAEAATVPLREGGLFGGSGPGGLASSFHPVHSTNAALLSSMKSLYGHEHAYPDGLTAAAALGFPVPLAATTANGLPPGLPAAFSPAAGPHHPALHGAPHPLLLGAGAAHREHFSLYPWLMSRHGGYFGHGRFPGPDASHLLLQPFRKPKRIRTAFSPSQLLRLEHAFEKNHYVVGQERKDLAVNLSLTETQVKVWFQNRRTKYKRMKAEEAESDRGGGVKDGSKAPGSPRSDSSDKPLDVSSCPEDDEEEEELEMELVDEDMEEEEEIIDCVTSPEDASSSNRNHGNPAILRYDPHHPHHHPHHPAHHLPRPPVDPLDHHSHHSDSSPGGGQGQGQGQGQIHNHQVGQGNNHTSSPQGQSRPPRSPSPNAAKTAHHVERWRSETNQMQAV